MAAVTRKSCVSCVRLRDENTRMKQMIADLSLDKHILQEALKGKF
jgi:hypothetical protein